MKKDKLISIIDDDVIYKYAIKIQFQEVGVMSNIVDFDNGEDALHYMTQNLSKTSKLPDYIFLDINMPIMDGFEFMEEFIKLQPNIGKPITVYMVSSSVNNVDIERAKAISQISDYIIKPMSVDHLKTFLNKL